MPEAVNINFRTEQTTKQDFEMICDAIGINTSTALNIYMKEVIRKGGIPFKLHADKPGKRLLAAIEEAHVIANDPKAKRYKNADELFADIEQELADEV